MCLYCNIAEFFALTSTSTTFYYSIGHATLLALCARRWLVCTSTSLLCRHVIQSSPTCTQRACHTVHTVPIEVFNDYIHPYTYDDCLLCVSEHARVYKIHTCVPGVLRVYIMSSTPRAAHALMMHMCVYRCLGRPFRVIIRAHTKTIVQR